MQQKEKKPWYDKDAILQDCNVKQFCEYLGRRGMRTKRAGNTLFIECPSGNHTSVVPTQCSATEHGAHCFACPDGANNFNAIDIAKAYRRNYGNGDDSFPGALEEIVGFLGNSSRYYADGSLKKEEKKQVIFPYTDAELDACGLYSDPKQGAFSAQILYENNSRQFNELLCNKAEEEERKLKKLLEVLNESDPESFLRKLIPEVRNRLKLLQILKLKLKPV